MIEASSVQTPALVYVRSPRGPWPQVWWTPVTDIDGHWRDRVVAAHPLSDFDLAMLNRGAEIAMLTRLFPPPARLPADPKVTL